MIPTEILKSFCGDKVFNGERQSLKKPFNQGGFTYATDEIICIRVPLIKRYKGNIGPDVSKLWEHYSKCLVFTPLPTVDKGILSYRFTVGITVELLFMHFSYQVIRRLSVFENVTVSIIPCSFNYDEATIPSFFRFDGGEGLFMPVRV